MRCADFLTTSHPDSRTFPRETGGILLGSSQNVNVVLFSLACRKESIPLKYFESSHLHLSGWGPEWHGSCSCGNLVETSVRSARPDSHSKRVRRSEGRLKANG